MPIKLLIALPLALLWASPAAADMTIRFAQNNARPIIVQLGSGGDSRMEVTDAVYLHTRGEDYLIGEDGRGRFVVRLADFTAMMSDLINSTQPADAEAAAGEVVIAEGALESVGGRTGRLYRISEANNPSDAFEVVVSSDPDLAPLSSAMRRLFGPVVTAATRARPRIGAALIGLLDRGALLRFGDLWRLESIDASPVDPAVFALPGEPISRRQLAERLSSSRPR